MRANGIVGLVAGALVCLSSSVAVAAQQNLDDIVAVVGEGVILESELESAVDQVRRRMGAQAQRAPENVLRSQVLDQLIITRLQTQRAQRAGIQVDASEIDNAVARVARQNNMSRQQFLSALRADGMQPSELRERLREDIMANKLRQRELAGKVVVTEQDVDRYLESEQLRLQEDREYRIRHILVAVGDGASSESVSNARERAEELRDRARSGEESFGDIAIAHSDGQKALEGGDLGWLEGGFLPSLFSEVVPQLSEGEVSDVFRGPSGFHVIKLAGIRNTERRQPAREDAIVQEVKARQILLRPNEIRGNERTHEEIKRLHQRLLAGDDFTELARSNSDDSGSANQGGDMGWVRPDQLPRAMAKPLQQLETGEVSEPFRTSEGWHVVRVDDRRERDLTEERRRQRARQAIGQRKLQEESEVWIRKLRDEAYVEIRMDGYTGS